MLPHAPNKGQNIRMAGSSQSVQGTVDARGAGLTPAKRHTANKHGHTGMGTRMQARQTDTHGFTLKGNAGKETTQTCTHTYTQRERERDTSTHTA